jgi:hypothetical protein
MKLNKRTELDSWRRATSLSTLEKFPGLVEILTIEDEVDAETKVRKLSARIQRMELINADLPEDKQYPGAKASKEELEIFVAHTNAVELLRKRKETATRESVSAIQHILATLGENIARKARADQGMKDAIRAKNVAIVWDRMVELMEEKGEAKEFSKWKAIISITQCSQQSKDDVEAYIAKFNRLWTECSGLLAEPVAAGGFLLNLGAQYDTCKNMAANMDPPFAKLAEAQNYARNWKIIEVPTIELAAAASSVMQQHETFKIHEIHVSPMRSGTN